MFAAIVILSSPIWLVALFYGWVYLSTQVAHGMTPAERAREIEIQRRQQQMRYGRIDGDMNDEAYRREFGDDEDDDDGPGYYRSA